MMGRGYDYYNMMGGGYGWVGGLLVLLCGLAVFVGVVLLLMWAVKSSGGHGGMGHGMGPGMGRGGAAHDEAVAIAKRRLAAGEITKEQYDELMRTLSG